MSKIGDKSLVLVSQEKLLLNGSGNDVQLLDHLTSAEILGNERQKAKAISIPSVSFELDFCRHKTSKCGTWKIIVKRDHSLMIFECRFYLLKNLKLNLSY